MNQYPKIDDFVPVHSNFYFGHDNTNCCLH